MSVWTLTLRKTMDQRVDASAIRLADWMGQSVGHVERTPLVIEGTTVAIADLFTVRTQTRDQQRILIEGDLSSFDRIGDRHHSGRIHIAGSVGAYAGACMSGGQIAIEGDAGDYLAAPQGSARQGMRGGRITVGGSAGHYVGHRMRRGEVYIEGNVGRFAASQMFAGTLVVAGDVGDSVATGMRRGTVITSRPPALPDDRFSEAVMIRSVFPKLLALGNDQSGSVAISLKRLRNLVDGIASEGFASRRGDRAVIGQGEVLFPLRSFEQV